MMPIPITLKTSDKDVSGHEELINCYPRKSEGSNYPFVIMGSEGLKEFIELPAPSISGLHVMGDHCYAVTPYELFRVSRTKSYEKVANLEVKGRVSIADNGYHLVIVDGKKGYVFNERKGEIQDITEREGFYPADNVEFQDGYFIFNRKGTGQFFISNLYGIDFDALDFATAEAKPDNLLGLISDHRELILFGERTIEVWYNSGGSDFPFSRNPSAFLEIGCGSHESIAKISNSVFFVGNDSIVYRMDGYSPRRVSTHAIEETLQTDGILEAFAYTYKSEGHHFYMLTIPKKKITWCYDISTGLWHRRESYEKGLFIGNNSAQLYDDTLIGDMQTGKIYELTNKYHKDGDNPLIRTIVLPSVKNKSMQKIRVNNLRLDIETGFANQFGEGSDPKIVLTWSKNGGITYLRNSKEASLGKIGELNKKVIFRRFGSSEQFTFKLVFSEPLPIKIGGAYIS